MNKFNIGDLVKIGTVEGSPFSVTEMYKFKGHVGRIIERHHELDFQHLVKIENTDHWWFDENILTPIDDLTHIDGNRRFIDAFLEGKPVEALFDTGNWLRIFAITPEIARLKMRFAKSDEVKFIEKEIESIYAWIEYIQAEIETLAKQKKDIDLKIKYAKAKISRREKKLKTLS